MKKFLFGLMAILLISISTNAQEQPKNSIKKGESIYKFNEDNSVSKFIKGVFVYDIIYDGYKPKISEENNIFITTNPETGEYFKVYNIRVDGDLAIFDIETNDEIIIEDVIYKQENWGPIVGVLISKKIVDLISDLISGTDLQQCTKAMESLNCSPKTPYMIFSEGNWFSNPSCEVGCR